MNVCSIQQTDLRLRECQWSTDRYVVDWLCSCGIRITVSLLCIHVKTPPVLFTAMKTKKQICSFRQMGIFIQTVKLCACVCVHFLGGFSRLDAIGGRVE